jgi:hypothetical protein
VVRAGAPGVLATLLSYLAVAALALVWLGYMLGCSVLMAIVAGDSETSTLLPLSVAIGLTLVSYAIIVVGIRLLGHQRTATVIAAIRRHGPPTYESPEEQLGPQARPVLLEFAGLPLMSVISLLIVTAGPQTVGNGWGVIWLVAEILTAVLAFLTGYFGRLWHPGSAVRSHTWAGSWGLSWADVIRAWWRRVSTRWRLV